MRRLVAGFGTATAVGGAAYAYQSRRSLFIDHLHGRPVDGEPFGLHNFDYDLVVIGGGSGGLAAAKQAAAHGARVALCDFVNPTNHGTTWGIGGTCVNVGCIPKKLMHTAALIGDVVNHDSVEYGHADSKGKSLQSLVSWDKLQQNVENYIRSICFGYVTDLRSKDVKYLNAFARFEEPHVITATDKKGQSKTVSARRFILAPGGRPSTMGIPGEEHCITSDDLFRMKTDPKKTLVVGGGYIALECAGFLHGIGRSATVMMRSIPLRGMDRDMAERATDYMEKSGIPVMRQALPTKIEKVDGRLKVSFKDRDGNELNDTFDTVLMAVGRKAQVGGLDLEQAGVKLVDGKIEVDEYNRTTAEHIYALGDAIRGGLELTPVAIKAGNLLSDRLYHGGHDLSTMQGVPTTVFTPLEYSFVGLSEEQAIDKYGDKLDVFHSMIQPLEWTVPHRPNDACYVKMLVENASDKVVGFHILAPNAGEITQGVAVALRAGATKHDFDDTVGIHPTIAETMTTLKITKASGVDPSAGGGC